MRLSGTGGPSGGTGRRDGFKIHFSQGSARSSRAWGTIFVCALPPANPTRGFRFEEIPLTCTVIVDALPLANRARERWFGVILLTSTNYFEYIVPTAVASPPHLLSRRLIDINLHWLHPGTCDTPH